MAPRQGFFLAALHEGSVTPLPLTSLWWELTTPGGMDHLWCTPRLMEWPTFSSHQKWFTPRAVACTKNASSDRHHQSHYHKIGL